MIDKTILLGDIGGTNARFALTSPNDSSYTCFKKFRCADFDTVIEAINSYLKHQDVNNLQEIYLAIAAPVYGDKVKIINNHWTVDKKELTKTLSLKKINIINDYESIVYAIDSIANSNYHNLGPLKYKHNKNMSYNLGIVGPGTGLGGSSLRKTKKRVNAYAAELGHVGFSPQNEIQVELTEILKNKFHRVINETFVSGPGIQNIFWALHQIKNKNYKKYSTEEIFNQANSDELSKCSIEIFFEMLGQVAGDFALATGNFDGILITGDLINNHQSLIKNSRFRYGFDNKDNYQDFMQRIPTSLIDVSEIGLLGIYRFFKTKKLNECSI